MYVKRLELTNFRLFEKTDLEFADGINLITGRNGCGKTSVLESIYFLALTKSFRTSQDFQIIKHQKDYFNIKGYFATDKKSKKISRVYYSEKDGKHMFLNSKEIKKYSEYIGFLPCVLLQPDDIKLTLGAPADRRKFLDILLSQISPVYLKDLRIYKRVLIQRNALLASEEKLQIENQIDIWNSKLIDHGTRIIRKRIEFVNFLDNILGSYYNNLSNKDDTISVNYESSIIGDHNNASIQTIKELFKKRMSLFYKYELQKKTTVTGPHRDDVLFFKNGKLFKDYASQGENKSLIIALKLLEWNYLSQAHDSRPVLLFDDIFSELDQSRIKGLLRFLKDVGQTFITTTLIDKFSSQFADKNIHLGEIFNSHA